MLSTTVPVTSRPLSNHCCATCNALPAWSLARSPPQVEIQLHERISSDTMRACLDDVADVGVCVASRVPVRLDAWHFADDPLIVVVPCGHPLASATALRLRQVAASPLVTAQSGGNLDRMVKDNAAAERLQLKVAVTVNSLVGCAAWSKQDWAWPSSRKAPPRLMQARPTSPAFPSSRPGPGAS